jgi:uncharacterized protein (TIGR02147 family)
MHNDWLFQHNTYREVLTQQLAKEGKGRGYRSLMARAAGCQPAYLSQVLAGSVQLTPDQASGLCDLWQFLELEADYFLTLVHLGRAGQPGLTHRLEGKLQRLKEQHAEQKVGSVQAENQKYDREKALHYYLDWVPSAVHLCLMIPGHDHPSAIARRLKLDDGIALLTLQALEALGIVRKDGARWTLTNKTLHAADESLFAPHHHRNWREKAIEYFRYGRLGKNLHYTSVYCLDHDAFLGVRQELSRLIETSRRLALPAAEETLTCLNIDWFEI